MMVKCEGKTLEDCDRCNMWFAYTSEQYSEGYQMKVSQITCAIGGTRIFNEDGDIIEKY